MKKLLAFLGVVAAGVGVTYVGIPEAVDAELESQGHTCSDLEKGFKLLEETEAVFYLVLDEGLVPPNKYAGMLIGDCSSNECAIESDACSIRYAWKYKRTASYNGRRLFRIQPPLALAKALKTWASDTGGAIWLGEPKKAFALLKSAYPVAAENIFNVLEKNWARETTVPHRFFAGRVVRPVCSHGLLYTVGVGGTEPCDGAKEGWVPFVPGKATALRSALIEYTDEDLEAAEGAE